MRSNKKLINKNDGFTLIELLATIVILGLLALIVTPGVAKVIKNSKINTSESSMEGYIREVENAIALYMTDNGVYPTNINQLELDGKNISKIENANVTFGYGEIPKVTAEINGLYCIYEEKIGAICDENNFNVNVNLSSLSIGDAVYYNPVADIYCSAKENGNNNIYYVENNSTSGITEGCLKWNVLSKNEDGTLNLILDHNILSGVMWHGTDNASGPTVAKEALNNAIKDKWSDVLLRTDSFTHTFNNGEEDITYTVNYTGMKARLPYAQEIANAVGHETWDEDTALYTQYFYFDSKNTIRIVGYDKNIKTSSQAWLFDNLNRGSNATDEQDSNTCLYYGCNKNLGKINGDSGYWTSISVAGNFYPNRAWYVRCNGDMRSSDVNDTDTGIRPVVTLNN